MRCSIRSSTSCCATRTGCCSKDFTTPLGKVSYHIPCHSRVQNVGQKTREVLEWIPDTAVNTVERCAGHDGTYGVKREFFANSMKIGKPVFRRMAETEPDFVCSDCPIAGRRIAQGIEAEGRRASGAQGTSADAAANGVRPVRRAAGASIKPPRTHCNGA